MTTPDVRQPTAEEEVAFSRYIESVFAGNLSHKNAHVVIQNSLGIFARDRAVTREALFTALPELRQITENDLNGEGVINTDPRWQFALELRRAMKEKLEDQSETPSSIEIPETWEKCVGTNVFTPNMNLMMALTMMGRVNHDADTGKLIIESDEPNNPHFPAYLAQLQAENPDAEFVFS